MGLQKHDIIGIVGSGAMGSGIAQVAAQYGHPVILFDVNSEALEKAKGSYEKTFKTLVVKGKISREDAESVLSRIRLTNDSKELQPCALVIEAIVENLEIKKTTFKELEQIVNGSCILASNTSSLSITSIASACNEPSRVLGIHFFNPAPLMPLVEIIPGIATKSSYITFIKETIDAWGKSTVVAKDTPGFIVNRVARSFYGESIRIYEEGLADFATIDWVMRTIGGFRMGPFELMDFIGNDINYKVTETVWEQFFYEPRFKPSFTQKRLYEAKFFGKKSGRGYYDYSEGAINPVAKEDRELGQKIFMRVISMLINEAVDTVYLKVATKDDLETAMTKGVNYPKGLLRWADEIGIQNIYDELSELFEMYGEDRYRPSVLLKQMARKNEKFFN